MRKLLATLLPAVVLATVVPVAQGPTRPQIRHWALAVRKSGIVRAPAAFDMAGVAWPRGSRAPRAVSIRTSLDGVRWTGWSHLEPIERRAPRSTEPLYVRAARFADVRFSGHFPRGATLHVIDPGPDPAPPASSAVAAVRQPGIITRAKWGADESMRRRGPTYAEPVRVAIVHHTATTDSYAKSESPRIVRSIYAYHVRTNGWDDIGYNFLVDKYGQTFEGRFGGITRAVVGAQAEGFNRQTTGIAVIGNFAKSRPPSAAMHALKRIVAWKLDRGFVDPNGTTVYTSGGSRKWPAGKRVRLHTITDHRTVQATSCPGQPLHDALGWLRSAAATYGLPKLYGPKVSVPVITPNGDGVADAVRLTGRFTASMSWRADVVDHESRVLATYRGTGSTLDATWRGLDGARGVVPQDVYRFRIDARNAQGSTRRAYVPVWVWRYPNGTLFRVGSSVYALTGGALHRFSAPEALASRYPTAEAIPVSSNLLSRYRMGGVLGFREGAVVRVGAQIFVIADGKRRPTDAATLGALGYDLDSIIETTSAGIAPHPMGTALTVASGYPNGVALRSSDVREAWMTGGIAHPFLTTNVRRSYSIRDVDLVGPEDDVVNDGSSSAPVRFRDGSLLRAVGDATTYVISDGLRRPISTARTFVQMGYRASNVRAVSNAELGLQRRGPPL